MTRRSFAVLLIVLVVLQAAIFFASVKRSSDAQSRSDCTARLEGQAFSYAFDALSAPPVAPAALPGTKAFDESARGISVTKGRVPAHALRNIDRSC